MASKSPRDREEHTRVGLVMGYGQMTRVVDMVWAIGSVPVLKPALA